MRYVLLAGLLLLGCGRHEHEWPCKLWIDPSFSAEEQEQIISAVDEWNEATGGIVDVTPVIGDPPERMDEYNNHQVVSVTESDPMIRYRMREHPEIIGYADMRDNSLGIPMAPIPKVRILTKRIREVSKERSDPGIFRGVVLHELGHHWGLDHREGTVMNPYVQGQARCVTPEDVSAFCTQYNCSGRDVHSTCE